MSLVSFQNGRLVYKKWLPFYILEKEIKIFKITQQHPKRKNINGK